MKRLQSVLPASALVAVLALALVVGVSSTVDQVPVAPETVVAPASEASSPEPQDGTAEGIAVHGHWVIEVRDPDGTLAERREFENALVPTGAAQLGRWLARTETVGLWAIQISNALCSDATGSPRSCTMVEAAAPQAPAPHLFRNLTVAFDAAASGLALAGNFTAASAGDISVVRTIAEGATSQLFTDRTLSPGVPVAAGQIVQVTVTITFS